MIRALSSDPRLTRSERERRLLKLIEQAQLPNRSRTSPSTATRPTSTGLSTASSLEFDGWQAHGHRLRVREQPQARPGPARERATRPPRDRSAARQTSRSRWWPGSRRRSGRAHQSSAPAMLPRRHAVLGRLVRFPGGDGGRRRADPARGQVGAAGRRCRDAQRARAGRARHPRPRRRGDPRRRARRVRAVAPERRSSSATRSAPRPARAGPCTRGRSWPAPA